MRIGIVTLKLKFNYGGILQNYALQQVLKRLGHEPITIDCFPSYPWLRQVLSCCKTMLLWFLLPPKAAFVSLSETSSVHFGFYQAVYRHDPDSKELFGFIDSRL